MLFQGNIGKADNSVHGCPNVVGHIVEESTFCGIGCFCHRAQTIQLLVRLLLQSDHLAAALYFDQAEERQQHQQCHSGNEERLCPNGSDLPVWFLSIAHLNLPRMKSERAALFWTMAQ